MQSTTLVAENVKACKLGSKKKIKTKDMLETGMKNIVGINLMKATADQIN
jgi:hypothetical protein